MSTSNKVLSAGIGYTIGNYLIKGIVFLTIPIFARILPTKDYGIYNLYISYESILCHVVSVALYMSLKNAKVKWGRNEYLSYSSSILFLLVINMLVWLCIAIAFTPIWSTILGVDEVLVPVLVVHSFCSGVLTFYNMHMSLEYSYKSYLWIGAINGIFNVLLSILFISCIVENKYYGRVLGTVLPLVVITVYIIIFFWRQKKPMMNVEYWRYGLKYSIPLVPHALSQVILNQFDRVMINKMNGPEPAGIYSFAYNVYSIIAVTTTSLDKVWGAWFYESVKGNKIEDIRKKSLDYTIGVALFISIVVLISPEIIKIIGTVEYVEAMYVVIPLTVAGFFAFLYTLPAQVEYYYEKTSLIAIGTGGAAVVNIVLNFVFISLFGYIAAGYTTVITYILYYIFHYMIAKHLTEKQFFEGKKLAVCGVFVCLVGLFGVFFVNIACIRWGIALLLGVVFCVFANKRFHIVDMLRKRKKG